MNAESLPLNYTKDGKIVESIWKITFSKAPYTNWFIKEIIRETIFPNMKGNKKCCDIRKEDEVFASHCVTWMVLLAMLLQWVLIMVKKSISQRT